MFRGFPFAGVRDTISQGIPFMCSDWVRENLFLPYFFSKEKGSVKVEDSPQIALVKHWVPVLFTSVAASVLSQWFHNCQMTMQADEALNHVGAVKRLWANNGIASVYRGVDARIGLLLVVCGLNEALLKPAWAGVPVSESSE